MRFSLLSGFSGRRRGFSPIWRGPPRLPDRLGPGCPLLLPLPIKGVHPVRADLPARAAQALHLHVHHLLHEPVIVSRKRSRAETLSSVCPDGRREVGYDAIQHPSDQDLQRPRHPEVSVDTCDLDRDDDGAA